MPKGMRVRIVKASLLLFSTVLFNCGEAPVCDTNKVAAFKIEVIANDTGFFLSDAKVQIKQGNYVETLIYYYFPGEFVGGYERKGQFELIARRNDYLDVTKLYKIDHNECHVFTKRDTITMFRK